MVSANYHCCGKLCVVHVTGRAISEFAGAEQLTDLFVCFILCLSELDCSCNQIERIPEEIGRCVRLKVLKCNGNRLDKLPHGLGQCKMIEELIISENALVELPTSIGSMTVLRILRASNNKIEEVPPELHACLALQEIQFSGNPTRNLPSELQSNVSMMLWIMKRQFESRAELQQLESATAELEDAARIQDERRLALEDTIRAVEQQRDKLARQMPHKFLKWHKRYENVKSKACTIS